MAQHRRGRPRLDPCPLETHFFGVAAVPGAKTFSKLDSLAELLRFGPRFPGGFPFDRRSRPSKSQASGSAPASRGGPPVAQVEQFFANLLSRLTSPSFTMRLHSLLLPPPPPPAPPSLPLPLPSSSRNSPRTENTPVASHTDTYTSHSFGSQTAPPPRGDDRGGTHPSRLAGNAAANFLEPGNQRAFVFQGMRG